MQQGTQAPRMRMVGPGGTISRWGAAVVLLVVGVVIAAGWLAISKTQGPEALADVSEQRKVQIADLTESLTRTGRLADGVEAEVILTTPDFFRLTRRAADGAALGADTSVVFIANETVHFGSLPERFSPILRINGSAVHVPTEVRVLTDAEHHRTNAVIFGDVPVSMLAQPNGFEMLLPAVAGATRDSIRWDTPIDYPDSVDQPAVPTLGLLLSLAAGVMAVISPCLLQLTAFYLPTLAGASVAAASSGLTPARQRRMVVGTALLFVAGFTIPYTLGGVLMGGIGEQLAKSGLLREDGPIVIGAGLLMIVMAGIVAYRARAPLVCKVPVPSRFAGHARLAFLVPFVSGFAIATGCLACFGGAILGVLLVYAGILGSPLLGGLAMFVFSMGLAIPFLLAALSVSWIAPLATRMQRATPMIGLVSAAIMLMFGAIMASGNFHAVSGWLARTLPLS